MKLKGGRMKPILILLALAGIASANRYYSEFDVGFLSNVQILEVGSRDSIWLVPFPGSHPSIAVSAGVALTFQEPTRFVTDWDFQFEDNQFRNLNSEQSGYTIEMTLNKPFTVRRAGGTLIQTTTGWRSAEKLSLSYPWYLATGTYDQFGEQHSFEVQLESYHWAIEFALTDVSFHDFPNSLTVGLISDPVLDLSGAWTQKELFGAILFCNQPGGQHFLTPSLFTGEACGLFHREYVFDGTDWSLQDIDYSAIRFIRTPEGDANNDGEVGFEDFFILSNNFNQAESSWSDGDFNEDGVVDFSDFLLLSGNFSGGEIASVPEPSGMWQAISGLAIVLRALSLLSFEE